MAKRLKIECPQFEHQDVSTPPLIIMFDVAASFQAHSFMTTRISFLHKNVQNMNVLCKFKQWTNAAHKIWNTLFPEPAFQKF
jgi:hypothetical protein